jgi:hypothetical protein
VLFSDRVEHPTERGAEAFGVPVTVSALQKQVRGAQYNPLPIQPGRPAQPNYDSFEMRVPNPKYDPDMPYVLPSEYKRIMKAGGLSDENFAPAIKQAFSETGYEVANRRPVRRSEPRGNGVARQCAWTWRGGHGAILKTGLTTLYFYPLTCRTIRNHSVPLQSSATIAMLPVTR